MRNYLGVLAVAGLASLPALASAAGPSLGDVLTNSGIAVSGDVETSYTHGFNKGQTLGPFREFDSAGDSFTFNQALLNVAYLPSDGFGAATTLVAGDDGKVISGTYGDNSGNFALNQAYVQYAHGPFTIIAGRYNTLSGAEVIQASGDTNYSRSILYYSGEPFVHTGVRASYAIAGATIYLGLANTVYGNPNGSGLITVSQDKNKNKAIEAGVALPAFGPVTLALFNYYTNDTEAGAPFKQNLSDFVATITATDKLSFVINGDWNHTYGSPAVESNFYGVAAYANYTINDTWKASLRGEIARSKNTAGFAPGSNNLSEITATIGYTPISHLTLLGEFRSDFSHEKIYPNGADPLKDSQPDIAVSAIYSF